MIWELHGLVSDACYFIVEVKCLLDFIFFWQFLRENDVEAISIPLFFVHFGKEMAKMVLKWLFTNCNFLSLVSKWQI